MKTIREFRSKNLEGRRVRRFDGLRKIRNTNIEIRNKFEFSKSQNVKRGESLSQNLHFSSLTKLLEYDNLVV
jgi:hypothetical protein